MNDAGNYMFSKAKLPASLSYPLKRSLLDAALDGANVRKQVYSVYYVLGKGHGRQPWALDVWFNPEGRHSRPAVAGKCSITVWAVPSDERRRIESVLIQDGLPLICDWLTAGVSGGNVWRGSSHGLRLFVNGGSLTVDQY